MYFLAQHSGFTLKHLMSLRTFALKKQHERRKKISLFFFYLVNIKSSCDCERIAQAQNHSMETVHSFVDDFVLSDSIERTRIECNIRNSIQ